MFSKVRTYFIGLSGLFRPETKIFPLSMVTQGTVDWVIMKMKKHICVSLNLVKYKNLNFVESQCLKQKLEVRL